MIHESDLLGTRTDPLPLRSLNFNNQCMYFILVRADVNDYRNWG